MSNKAKQTVYESDTTSLPVSDKPYIYPINSLLSQTIQVGDEINAILLVKRDSNLFYIDNVDKYKRELVDICGEFGICPSFHEIETDFDETQKTHFQLMDKLIDSIDVESRIFADITYGPKDLPIVVFSTLFFAENYLNCSIENIVYGQAFFKADQVERTRICDMTSLYYLSSLSNTINCNDPQKARTMIKDLLLS